LADAPRAKIANQNTVRIIAATPETMVDLLKISASVAHVDGMRVLPMIGRGSLQTLSDLVLLDGVDGAVLASDSLAYAQRNGFYDRELRQISYLAKIATANVVLVGSKAFPTLDSLKGRKIATGLTDSDAYIAAELILGQPGADFERVASSGEEALNDLRAGRIDAALFTGRDAVDVLGHSDGVADLHIIPLPYSDALAEAYAPAMLTHADFPSLIAKGQAVDTLAAAEVLAAHDWPRASANGRKLEKFSSVLLQTYLSATASDGATNYWAAVPGWKPYTHSQFNGALVSEPSPLPTSRKEATK
jgi:hypothetical protein